MQVDHRHVLCEWRRHTGELLAGPQNVDGPRTPVAFDFTRGAEGRHNLHIITRVLFLVGLPRSANGVLGECEHRRIPRGRDQRRRL